MDTERNKRVVLVVWVACVLLMLFVGGLAGTIGTVVFWALVLAHLGEFVVKRGVMAKAGGSMGHHFVQTLLYGLFHWKPLEEAQKQAAAESGSGGGTPGA